MNEKSIDTTSKYDDEFIYHYQSWVWLPDYMKRIITKDPQILDNGYLNRGRLMEIIFANASGGNLEHLPSDGCDFKDLSELRTVSATPKRGRTYSTYKVISVVGNKIGPIRMMVWHPALKQMTYYFIFKYPREGEEYIKNGVKCTYGKNARIEFDTEKSSKYSNGEWGYKVSSLEKLAKIVYDPKEGNVTVDPEQGEPLNNFYAA